MTYSRKKSIQSTRTACDENPICHAELRSFIGYESFRRPTAPQAKVNTHRGERATRHGYAKNYCCASLSLNMKAWLIRLYAGLFNLHSRLWTQFCGQTAKGKNQTSCSINNARFCYQVREDIGEVVREEIKRNVALRSGKSHCCDQPGRQSTAQSMEDAKLKRWMDGPLRKQTSLKVSQSDVQACKLTFVASLLSYQKAKADLFTSCGAVQTKHLKR